MSVLILVCMERGDPSCTNYMYLGVSFSSSQGVVTPLGRRVTKKGLVRQGSRNSHGKSGKVYSILYTRHNAPFQIIIFTWFLPRWHVLPWLNQLFGLGFFFFNFLL